MENSNAILGLESNINITNCSSKEELQEIYNSPVLSNYQMSTNKYPRLKTSISKEQIEQLIESGIIGESGDINEEAIANQSSLSQLLYSFLWKQGDIQKIKHIISEPRTPNYQTTKLLHSLKPAHTNNR